MQTQEEKQRNNDAAGNGNIQTIINKGGKISSL